MAMPFPVFMAFAYPASYVSAMHQPAPHHMEVVIVPVRPPAGGPPGGGAGQGRAGR
ncbi:hypothetical protein QJS66_15500 [Kocuria rhizophila]|nr:hypothetical protein QJS66_15500 [Kocuria rhizophila]